MLKSNKVNMILALIVAIVLWVYVLGDVNPETKVTVRNVPVTFINESLLEESGLTMLSSSHTTVNVSVSGKRTVATKVKQSDFNVSADLEALKAGTNTVRLNVTGPDDVKILGLSADKIEVVIDKMVTEEKPVKAVVAGETNEDKEPYVVEVGKDSAAVTGAKTLVDKVDRLEAIIDASRVESNMKTKDVLLIPVDEKGIKIDGLTIGTEKVSVTVVMLNKKTVHLEVPVINQNKADAERIISYPKTVAIIGTADDLKDINKLTCGPLDVGDIFENTTVELTPILPVGIQMGSGFKEVYATVTVKALSKAQFTFTGDNITIFNAEDGLRYSVGDISFSIAAMGKEGVVSGLTAADFKISVDAKGLERGTHSVVLNITCEKGIASFKATAEKAEIIIE